MSINNLTEEENYDLPTDKELDCASIDTMWSVAKLQADSTDMGMVIINHMKMNIRP
jgi:hypothetical protein